MTRRRTKSKSVFDDEDVLFKIHEEAPPVDLFGSVSPVAAAKVSFIKILLVVFFFSYPLLFVLTKVKITNIVRQSCFYWQQVFVLWGTEIVLISHESMLLIEWENRVVLLSAKFASKLAAGVMATADDQATAFGHG